MKFPWRLTRRRGELAHSNYRLWQEGLHERLLEQNDLAFLEWAANHNRFPSMQWEDNFLRLGALKRKMWKRIGKQAFPWVPIVELRVPMGCTASCSYCSGARYRSAPHANTKKSLLEFLELIQFPETVSLCAEWGDPCMHPDLIEAINKRIEEEWLVTKYTFLTNLSLKDAVLKALPYTRSLLVHFTMAEPRHAVETMGYHSEKLFYEAFENVRSVGQLRSTGDVSTKIIVLFIVDPSTVGYITEHYKLFRELKGIAACRYKSEWKHVGKLTHDPAALNQKEQLESMRGSVPYEWAV